MATQHWLVKTEPSTYSFSDLKKDGKTLWNGVRNFQARNFLREVKKGDLFLIYHSGGDKAVVGVARALGEPTPEKTSDKGEWVQVELAPVKALEQPVTLTEIKKTEPLKNLLLIRHTRLSVMPLTDDEFRTISKMGAHA